MTTTRLFIVFICVFIFGQSCENNKNEQPEIVYKDSLGNIIVNDTIEVAINSSYELLIETKYDLSNPEYFAEYNSDLVNITDSENVNIISHGWNGEIGLNFENVKLFISFPDTDYENGETIRIITRINTISDGMISKSKFYKIN